MQIDDRTFYIVLIIAIIIILYLFWRHTRDTNIYQRFDPNLNSEVNTVRPNPEEAINRLSMLNNDLQNDLTGVINNSRVNGVVDGPRLESLIGSATEKFNQILDHLSMHVRSLRDVNLTPEQQSKVKDLVDKFNNVIQNFNNYIAPYTDKRLVPINIPNSYDNMN